MTSIISSPHTIRSRWNATSFLPLLLRPRVVGWINARGARGTRAKRITLDGIVCLFIALLVWSLWLSGIELIQRARFEAISIERWISFLFSAVIASYAVLLFTSSFIAALGALFLANDLELLVAAPVSKMRFFIGKLSDVMVCAAWLPLLIAMPLLGGVAYAVYAHWSSYLVLLVYMSVLTLGVTSLSLACAVICGLLIPARRARELVLGAVLLTGVLLYMGLHQLFPQGAAHQEVSVLLYQFVGWGAQRGDLDLLALIGNDLSRVITRGDIVPGIGSFLLLGGVGISAALGFGAIHSSYLPGVSRMIGGRSSLRINSRAAEWRLKRVLMFLPLQVRAVAGKELRMFSRDMLQTLQLAILLGVTFIYLYNFQTLQEVGQKFSPSVSAQRWWDALLVLLNLFVGGMVICAVCVRFVFPAVSMEGRSFWIIRASPFKIESYLNAKHLTWFVPISIISSVILATGACAIQAEPRVIIVSTIVSWIMCYGIVWLAVGLGAFFANFSFEHYAQLTGSFGSLVFILASGALVLLDLIPAGVILSLRTLRNEGVPFSPQEWYSSVVASATLLVVLNALIGRWAKKFGAQALLVHE